MARSGLRLLAVSALLLALHSLGCTDPSYERALKGGKSEEQSPRGDAATEEPTREADAGHVGAEARLDAGTPPKAPTSAEVDAMVMFVPPKEQVMTPVLPAQPVPASAAADLNGHYAVMHRFFAKNEVAFSWFAETAINLAEIRADESGKLTLYMDVCRYESKGAILTEAFQGHGDTSILPDYSAALAVEGTTFRTIRAATPFGFEPLSAESCPPGKKVQLPNRPWTGAQGCTCPNPAQEIPTSGQDCRVTDPDKDNKPGLTVRWEGSPIEGENFTVTLDSSQFVDGVISPSGRHTAHFQWGVRAMHLKCESGLCGEGVLEVCPAKDNPVVFQRLVSRPDGSPWTCETMLREIVDTHVLPVPIPTGSPC